MHKFFDKLFSISPAYTQGRRILHRLEKQKERLVRLEARSLQTQAYMYYSTLFENADEKVDMRGEPREKELIVTLTSLPYRINKVHITIESIFRQSIKPNRIVLNLDQETFNDENIPLALKKQQKRGLEIQYVKDIGPYTKLLPTIKRYPNQLYVTCDDDIIVGHEWLEKLYTSNQKNPEMVHCHRAHRVEMKDNGEFVMYNEWEHAVPGNESSASLLLFPTGVGGVIYSQEHFSENLFDEQTFTTICPKADDIWFKCVSLQKDTLCCVVPDNMTFNKSMPFFNFFTIPDTQEYRLMDSNVAESQNDLQLKAVVEAFGLHEKLFEAQTQELA